MRTQYEGRHAWRNGFSRDAADLLQIFRWANELSDETFKRLLLVFACNPRQTNVRSVERILFAFSTMIKERG